MRHSLLLLLLLPLIGCTAGSYKMSKDNYRQQVKTLGVVPLLVDDQSTILHPNREAVLDLLTRQNAGKAPWLVEELRDRKGYFDVREISGDPRALFAQLVAGSTIGGEGEKRHRSYSFQPAAVNELCRRNAVDGILVVVMNGLVRPEKRWDRDKASLNFLQTDYNVILASAAVVLPSGVVAWDRAGDAKPFLDLQYPDFDEAYFNATDSVRLRFISVEGLDRTLARRDQGLLFKSSLSQRYKELFSSLADALTPGLLEQLSGSRPAPATAK
jgi:hypothetical protein